MRAMIQLQNISVQRGTKFLLDSADLTIYPGQKVGLIGANGTGKSTLFQLLLGSLQSDTGSLDIPRQWRIAHMAQEVGHTNRSALDYVLDGDSELRRLEQEIAQANLDIEHNGEKLAHLYSDMENIHAYTAPSRAQQLPKQQQANALVRAEATRLHKVEFIDVATPMLGADGQPRAELFIEDQLHMNRAGYQLWRGIVAPYLD